MTLGLVKRVCAPESAEARLGADLGVGELADGRIFALEDACDESRAAYAAWSDAYDRSFDDREEGIAAV